MRTKGHIIPDEALRASSINSTDKVVLAYLINRCYNSNEHGEDLTQPEMAKDLKISLVTLNTSIKRLEAFGYIDIEKVVYVNNRKRNVYRINWKNIEDAE